MKRQLWLGLAVSAVCLYAAFRSTDWRAVGASLAALRPVWLLPSLAFTCLSLPIRAYRWRFFFTAGTTPTYRTTLSAVLIGNMANNILPARVGELVKAYVVGRRSGIPVATSFATVVAERVFDFLSLFVLFGLVMVLAGLGAFDHGAAVQGVIATAGYVSVVIGLAALAGLLLVRFRQAWAEERLCRLAARFVPAAEPRVRSSFRSCVHGLDILGDGKRVAAVLALSLVIWGVLALSVHFMLLAAGTPRPYLVSVFILLAMAFGVSVPSAPGSVGTFHYACVVALGAVGVDPAPAKSFAIAIWTLSVVPLTAVGFLVLFLEGLSLAEIRTLAVPAAGRPAGPGGSGGDSGGGEKGARAGRFWPSAWAIRAGSVPRWPPGRWRWASWRRRWWSAVRLESCSAPAG